MIPPSEPDLFHAPMGRSLAKLLESPLILGASVSADYATASPGKRLALRYTSIDRIQVRARSGTPARELLKNFHPRLIQGRSIVIGMDLFFWDGCLLDPMSSVEALEALVMSLREMGVPGVIGTIPDLIPGRQPSRMILNQEIREVCGRDPVHCRILDLDAIHRQVLHDLGLEWRGRFYSFHQLVPDGLHVGEIAAEYLADRLLESILAENPVSRGNA